MMKATVPYKKFQSSQGGGSEGRLILLFYKSVQLFLEGLEHCFVFDFQIIHCNTHHVKWKLTFMADLQVVVIS